MRTQQFFMVFCLFLISFQRCFDIQNSMFVFFLRKKPQFRTKFLNFKTQCNKIESKI